MDALFMNSKNRKTSDPHKLLPNSSNKIDLKRSNKYVALSNVWRVWMKSLNHLMDHIL